MGNCEQSQPVVFGTERFSKKDSIREIQEVFPDRAQPAYTTIQTTVYRLEVKKAVRRIEKVGALVPTSTNSCFSRFWLNTSGLVPLGSQELPVYELVVAKDGSKLHESKTDEPGSHSPHVFQVTSKGPLAAQ